MHTQLAFFSISRNHFYFSFANSPVASQIIMILFMTKRWAKLLAKAVS